MTAANEKPDCPHKHTGSCSPDGVYLYVRCMDCWEILMMSDEGRRRLSECQGYEPPKKEFGRHCIHCDFDFWDHKRRAQTAEGVDEAAEREVFEKFYTGAKRYRSVLGYHSPYAERWDGWMAAVEARAMAERPLESLLGEDMQDAED